MTNLSSKIKNISIISTLLIQLTLCLTIIIGETLILRDFKESFNVLIGIVVVPIILGVSIKLLKVKSKKIIELGYGLIIGSIATIILFSTFYIFLKITIFKINS